MATLVAQYQKSNEIKLVMEEDGNHAAATVYAQPGQGYTYSIDRNPQTYVSVVAAQAAAEADMAAKLAAS